MNKNEKFVITINRELGSGGRTVGRKLAEQLQVNYYDKALIQELTKEFGLTVEEIEKIKAQKKSWWNEFNNYYKKRNSTNLPMEAETVLTTESMMATENASCRNWPSRSRALWLEEAAFWCSMSGPTTSTSSYRHLWRAA